MRLLTTTSVGTIFAAASSVYPHKMQMDRAVLPDNLSRMLGSRYSKLLRKGSHRLYYSYLCGDTGITAERNFADPEYSAAYYGLCSQGALCKTYEFIANKFLADEYAGTFYSVEQCIGANKRFRGKLDDVSNEDIFTVRRLMDIDLTLEIMRRLEVPIASPGEGQPSAYFNLHHGEIYDDDHWQSVNYDEFSSGFRILVSDLGHLVIKINTRREDYYYNRKYIGLPENYAKTKDFGMLNTVLVLSPSGDISMYYPEDHWKILGTEPSELIFFDSIMCQSEATAQLMFWHILYSILRTTGDIFEIAPYLTKDQVCALFYEAAQAAQNPVPGINAPQEGALSDLLATISSKITLIPSSGRS